MRKISKSFFKNSTRSFTNKIEGKSNKYVTYISFGFLGGLIFSYLSPIEDQEDFDTFSTLVDNQVWTYTHYYQIKNILPMNTSENMCLIKLSNGDILLYNPVKLTQNIKKILNTIQNKSIHLVIPKESKLLNSLDYLKEYPNLNVYILQDFQKESNELFKEIKKFNLIEMKESPWKEIKFEILDGLNNFDKEIILYHQPSKMLLTSDTTTNITKETAKKNRLGFSYFTLFSNENKKFGNFNLKIMKPVDLNQYKSSLEKIMNDYDFNGIFMSLGTPINPYGEFDLKIKWKQDLNKIK